MIHKNGRQIYGVSFDDLRSGLKSRCNVSPVESRVDGEARTVHLAASGPGRGVPLKVADLSPEDQAAYNEWAAETAPPKTYTEAQIAEAVRDYCERHVLATCDVCRQYEGDDGPVLGFRLSAGDGTTTGGDESFGQWGQ